MYPLVRSRIDAIQTVLEKRVHITDQAALLAYDQQGPDAAIEYVTQFSVDAGNMLHETWMDFYGQLFVQFRDFYTIVPVPDEPSCGCQAHEPGLSEAMKDRIVRDTGDHYRVMEYYYEQYGGEAKVAEPTVVDGESGKDRIIPLLKASSATPAMEELKEQ
jgi:hypothetical protein